MRSGTPSGSSGGSAPSFVLAVALVAAVAGCGGHGATATRARLVPVIDVRLTADSHHPRVGKPWHYAVRVTDATGRPVPARVHLQILFAGAPVGQVGRHRVESGVWSETIGTKGNPPFPARARGARLVFQAVVTARGQTRKANYWVQVR
jgi:hypothetical protein